MEEKENRFAEASDGEIQKQSRPGH